MKFRDFFELAAKVSEYEELSGKKINGERPLWELTTRWSIMKNYSSRFPK